MGLFMVFVPLAQLAKDNLAKYSVYYAGNLPHKQGTDPELVAILDNLDKIYIPNLDESTRVVDELHADNYIDSINKKYRYDFLGLIIDYTNSKEKITLERGILGKTTSKGIKLLYFDSKTGKLLSIVNEENREYNPSSSDYFIFEKMKKDLVRNIIEARQKPEIDLQLIYNYLNKSKFN
jgi:hypothetical protein